MAVAELLERAGGPDGVEGGERGKRRPQYGLYHVAMRCCRHRVGYSHLPLPLNERPSIPCTQCGKTMPVVLYRYLRLISPEEIAELRRIVGDGR